MFANSPRFAGQPAAAFKLGLACAVTLLLAGAAAHATELVQNGDFSSNTGPGQVDNNTTVTDWTTTGYNFLFTPGQNGPYVSNGQSLNGIFSNGMYGATGLYTVTGGPTGGNFIALDADYDTAAITQTISGLTVGDTYDLTFEWAASQQTTFSGPTTQQLYVTLNGSPTQSTSVFDLPNHGFSGWMSESMDFTAAGNSEMLSFLASGSPAQPPFTLLADVNMQDVTPHNSPVPEPETLPLLLTGLMVGAGLIKYRGLPRRSQQSL